MEKLPGPLLEEFLRGNHVMRHKPGIWNALWSDMFIESTFMRYGHSPGGIVGITLKPSSLKRWALCLHICSQLVKDVSELKTNGSQVSVTVHKEEMPARKQSDAGDRQNLRERLATCIDPLQPENHPDGLVNIVTGRMSPNIVNADISVGIGVKQMKEYEEQWPDSFNKPLSKQVVTMAVSRKQIKVGQTPVYDTGLIYSRVLGLQAVRDINLKDILKFELAPVPPSMFEDNGDMRITKSKAVLKQKLQVEVSDTMFPADGAIIVDGCAMLWVIQWPSKGTVEDYVQNLLSYLRDKLKICDTYLVFDRYYDNSIKKVTRTARAGKDASRRHQLNLTTPLPAQKIVLTVTENKVQLINIICSSIKDHPEAFSTNTKLILTGPNPIPMEIAEYQVVERPDLRTTHEEADVIMVQQMVLLASSGVPSIRVISDDTDVFILLLHFYQLKELACNLVMAGTSRDRSSVDIKATVQKHAHIVTQVLAAHVVSGCDTVAYLWGIGKGTIVKHLKDGRQLNYLGDLDAELPDVISEATAFFAACYGSQETEDMSAIRFDVWSSKMANKKLTSAPELKTLPPTTVAFIQHVLRAHLQAAIWRAALDPDPPLIDPTSHGWSHEEVSSMLLPVSLPPDVIRAPDNVLKMIRCGCSSVRPCAMNRCSCSAARLSCSLFCGCHGMEECQNDQTKSVSASEAVELE